MASESCDNLLDATKSPVGDRDAVTDCGRAPLLAFPQHSNELVLRYFRMDGMNPFSELAKDLILRASL
jgi:hypothetical protein